MNNQPEATSTPRPKCLMLSPVSPFPPDVGAAQRSFLLYQALRDKYEVDLVLVNNNIYSPEVLATLRSDFSLLACIPADDGDWAPRRWRFRIPLVGKYMRRAVRVWLGARGTLFRSPAMSEKLRALTSSRRYDFIVSRYIWPAAQTDAFAQAPVYIDVDDLPSEVWLSRVPSASGLTRACTQRIARAYASEEQMQLSRAAGAWFAKAKDQDALRSLPAVGLLPNVPFASYPAGVSALPFPAASPPVVLGVGNFDWPPNRHGFEWFVSAVWPLIHAQRPDAALHVIGKMTDRRIAQSWEQMPGVRCLGRVADLALQYQGAALAVAPIFTGGGTNIKVIEALSFGRCCVLTPHAAKGFAGLDGLHVADAPGDFAQACLQLLAQPAKAELEGQRGSLSVNRQFSFASFKSSVLALLPSHSTEPGQA